LGVDQIRYQVKKLLIETYGVAEKDAYNFVQMAELEAEDGGFFNAKINQNNEFVSCISLSKSMLIYSQSVS